MYGEGSEEAFGHDQFHHRFPLRRREFRVEAEVVGRLGFGRPNRDPHLEKARLVLTELGVERLNRQLVMTVEAVESLGQQAAADGMLGAAERAVGRLRWPSATEIYDARIAMGPQMRSIWEFPAELERRPEPLTDDERASVGEATQGLEEELRGLQARFPMEGEIELSSHAHLDLAWLWPMAETRRKARRTFHTAIGLMDRYEEFRFNQSSAQIYAFLEEDDPE